MKIKIAISIFLLTAMYPMDTYAVRRTTRTHATTGAQFLQVAIGGRPVGMGGAFGAVSDDVYALHYNPAGLADLQRPSISAQHTEFFSGINHEFLGVAYPYSKKITLGVSGLLSSAKDTNRPAVGVELGSFKIQDLALSFGAAYRVNRRLKWGGVFRLLNQRLAEEVSNSYSVDIGWKFKPYAKHLELGAVIQNIGPGIKFIEESDPLPLRLKLAASYRMFKNRLITDVDFNITRDQRLSGSIGSELNFRNFIFFRGGYRFGIEFTGVDAVNAGLGLRFGDMQVDYAFANFGELGGTHRISGTVDFGRSVDEKLKKKLKPKRKPNPIKKSKPIVTVQKPKKIYIISFLPAEPEMEIFADSIMNSLYTVVKGNKNWNITSRKKVGKAAKNSGHDETDFVWLMDKFNLDYILFGEYAVQDGRVHIEGTLVGSDGEMFFPLSDGRLKDMSKTLYKFFGKMDKLMKNQ